MYNNWPGQIYKGLKSKRREKTNTFHWFRIYDGKFQLLFIFGKDQINPFILFPKLPYQIQKKPFDWPSTAALDFLISETTGFRVKIIINFFRRLRICFVIFNICYGIADFGIAQAFNSCTSSQVLSWILFSIQWVLCEKKKLNNTNICHILIKIFTMIKERILWKSFLVYYMHNRQNLEMLLYPH